MEKANKELRQVAKEKNVKQWQIAEALGVAESALSQKLRHELPEEDKARFLSAVDQVERGAVNG